MTFTIDAHDPRSIKAIEIAAQAGQWAKVTLRDGRQVYGVPSQRDASHIYFVDLTSCTCEDFKRNGLSEFRVGFAGEHGLCKHIRAVRLLEELNKAQQKPTRSARPARRRAGHLSLVTPTVIANAEKYNDIFKRFEDE